MGLDPFPESTGIQAHLCCPELLSETEASDGSRSALTALEGTTFVLNNRAIGGSEQLG